MAEDLKMLNVRMKPADIEVVKAAAAQQGMSLQDYVTKTLLTSSQLEEWNKAFAENLARVQPYFARKEAERGPGITAEERDALVQSLMRQPKAA